MKAYWWTSKRTSALGAVISVVTTPAAFSQTWPVRLIETPSPMLLDIVERMVARYRRGGLFVLLACALLATGAHAREDFPVRPLRIVAPFPPGGAVDIVARAVAHQLSTQIGQPVLVDNRAGAAGTIGTELVARSAPDGYTLLLGATTTHGINPTLHPKLGYDAIRDFAPVSLVATVPHVLVVNPSVPVTTFQEFLGHAKAKPGMAFGSAGTGSPHHLAGEMIRAATGIDILHVPYKGSAPAMADVVAGQIPFMSIELTAAAPNLKAGKLRAIAIASPKRVPGFDDLATFAEQGLPNFEVTAWYGIFAPAGTPKERIAFLSKEIAKGLRAGELRDRLAGLHATPIGSTPSELAAHVKAEIVRWAKAIKASGAKPD